MTDDRLREIARKHRLITFGTTNSYVADLLAALREAAQIHEKDAQRLDAIALGHVIVSADYDRMVWRCRRAEDSGFYAKNWHIKGSLREAIDAAMQNEGKE